MPRTRRPAPSSRARSRSAAAGGRGGWDLRAIEAACEGDPARAARRLEAVARTARARAGFLARLRAFEMWHAAGDDRRVCLRARRLASDRNAHAGERARILVVFGRAAARLGRFRSATQAYAGALASARFEPSLALTIALEAAHAARQAGDASAARGFLEWAEARGATDRRSARWLDVHAALAELDASDGDLLLAEERLEHLADRGSGRRLATGRTLAQMRRRLDRQFRLLENALAAAVQRDHRALAASLRRGPEPKWESLAHVVSAQGRRLRAEQSLARGRPCLPPAAVTPRPRAGEAFVVVARAEAEVHAWILRADDAVSHLLVTGTEVWKSAAAELRGAWRDASGWPDGAVPPERAREAHRALESAAREIWTPMWPALDGVARVAVVPDPELPAVPWTALSLAAPPALRTRPRAVTVIPELRSTRPSAWRSPAGSVLSMSHRGQKSPLGEREAKAVVRLLGGEWLEAARLGGNTESPRRELERLLHGVRLWHVATPIVPDVERPSASGIRAGDELVPLWRLVRARVRVQLLAMSIRSVAGPSGAGRGEVVGRITPEGSRRLRPEGDTATASIVSAGDAIARLIVGSIAKRAVVNTGEGDSSASAAVLGSFYAGLARGDSPADSLFLAQRKAFDEQIHPAVWAEFTHWGWF